MGYQYQTVFGQGFVNFIETDAWAKMSYAQHISSLSFIDGLKYMVSHNQLFSWLISVIPGNIEVIGAWLPPVLSLGVIITSYFIAVELFGSHLIGLLSALFISIIPSEFFNRSQLGYADHHALEVLLLSLLILFTIKSVKYCKVWIGLAGFTLFLYMLNWPSGIYFAGLLLILSAVMFLILKAWKQAIIVSIIGIIGLALYLPIGGYHQLMFLIPGNESIPAQATGEIASTFASNPSQRTTSELMPLFYPVGKFTLNALLSNLNLFSFMFLLSIPLIWKYRKDKSILLFTLWTLIFIIVAINQRRFMYYATIPIGILSAVSVQYIASFVKVKVESVKVMVICIPVLIISLSTCVAISQYQPVSMSKDWHNALKWLKSQPTTGTVAAWGDYGHWINYTGKTAYYLPGPGGDLVASAFLSTDARDELKQMNAQYFIVDKESLTSKYFAISTYYKETIDKNTALAFELYYNNHVPDYLTLQYENGSLKIYEVK